MSVSFRKARPGDLDRIAEIYSRIHDTEEAGLSHTGWLRAVYPSRAFAAKAVALRDLYVEENDGEIVASARLNFEQVDVYAQIAWETPAPENRVFVLHTLTVDPEKARCGYGKAFVAFYEQMAKANGCVTLRIDTNEKNREARSLYKMLGYHEAGIVPCVFNGIPGVNLVCLEKKL